MPNDVGVAHGKLHLDVDLDMKKWYYKGYIARQALVDFCQAELPKLDKANEQLLDGLHYAEQANNIHTIHALNEGLIENYGYQKALRAVCEWAKEHMVEPEPIPDVDVSDLKKKFNGNE